MKATITKVQKRLDIKPSKTDGIINYDEDNAYPQRIIDIINSSGTGTLCTEIMAKFIYGDGFKDKEFGNRIVNSQGLTANKLLYKFARSLARFNGFSAHVNYNALFQKTEVNHPDFKDLRFTTTDNKEYPNMLALYDDWQKIKSRSIDFKQVDFINFYNPNPTVIQEQVLKAGGFEHYKGQILYSTIDGIEYPLAPSDSVLEDMQTDSHAKIFKFRNITTNFMASHIIETDEFESPADKDEFQNTLKDFQGSDDTSKILHIEKQAGQETSFNLTKVDIQDIEKLYEYTESSVRDNIIRNYLIPPVLLLAVAGKLGSSSEIKDATAFYNGMVSDYRKMLEEAFKELFTNFVGITQTDFEIAEKSANIVKVKDTAEGKKEIIELLGNSAIGSPQKRNILKVIYGYTDEEVNELVSDVIIL